MAQPAIADLTLHDLTLEERATLERAVDGPITPVMIADALRGRRPVSGSESSVDLRRLIAWASADIAFYRGQILGLRTEIAALKADGNGLYGEAEKDRKTRHIAALRRQHDGLTEHCRPYKAIIAEAQAKLAAQSPNSASGAICRSSASQDGLSED